MRRTRRLVRLPSREDLHAIIRRPGAKSSRNDLGFPVVARSGRRDTPKVRKHRWRPIALRCSSQSQPNRSGGCVRMVLTDAHNREPRWVSSLQATVIVPRRVRRMLINTLPTGNETRKAARNISMVDLTHWTGRAIETSGLGAMRRATTRCSSIFDSYTESMSAM